MVSSQLVTNPNTKWTQTTYPVGNYREQLEKFFYVFLPVHLSIFISVMSMKIPLTQAGIEPATFRSVTQHLNHCATAATTPPIL